MQLFLLTNELGIVEPPLSLLPIEVEELLGEVARPDGRTSGPSCGQGFHQDLSHLVVRDVATTPYTGQLTRTDPGLAMAHAAVLVKPDANCLEILNAMSILYQNVDDIPKRTLTTLLLPLSTTSRSTHWRLSKSANKFSTY